MGRTPCCPKEGVNRGAWSLQEDQILINYIQTHGEGKWRLLPQKAGLNRCGKSCRLRWLNYLRPDIKRGDISKDEEDLIIRLHRLLGNRWSLIAGRLPGRTDNEIKNYWNTNIAKRLCNAQKPPSKFARERSKSLEKNLVRHDQLSNNNSHLIRTTAVRCTLTKFSIINQDQGSHDHQMAMNQSTSNECINDSDHNTNTNSTTSTLELEEEHDPLGFLIDYDVGNIDIVFDKDQIDALNPYSDCQFPRDKDDRALNMSDADYDPLKNGRSSLPSLDPLMDANGIEINIEDKVDVDHEIKCEPKMEINLMLELKKVASFLDLEDEWNDV